MALAQQIIDVTEARISAFPLQVSGWSATNRESAISRLRYMGLPGRRY
jgi:Fe-S cluster assembly protein SufD